jgi:hypothetical protein
MPAVALGPGGDALVAALVDARDRAAAVLGDGTDADALRRALTEASLALAGSDGPGVARVLRRAEDMVARLGARDAAAAAPDLDAVRLVLAQLHRLAPPTSEDAR